MYEAPVLSFLGLLGAVPLAQAVERMMLKNLSSRTSACNKRQHSTRSSSTFSPVYCSASAPSADSVVKPIINVIPNNGQWANGVPPVMGAHLMASGVVAPISVSKGPGIDNIPHQFQYPTVEGNTEIILHFSKNGAAQSVVKAVSEAAAAAIQSKGSFTLVLSGGSVLGLLSGLAAVKDVDWSKVHVFFVDERNVSLSSSDSNYKGASDAFLSKVPIPANQVHTILENLPVEQAAINLEGRLIGVPASILPRNAENFPVFDLILLGVGPDGHVASLFPNTAATAATKGWVLPVANSPKPPAERVSFTMPVINSAKDVVIVALGEEKAEVVQRILEVQALPGALPAQLVRPSSGKLRWFLDVQSAQNLIIDSWADTKQFPRSQ